MSCEYAGFDRIGLRHNGARDAAAQRRAGSDRGVFFTQRAGTRFARQSRQRTNRPCHQGGFMAGSVFGIGSPLTYPTSQSIPFGLSPYGPFTASGGPFTSPQQYGPPLQQILQILQIVPQQLQHLQQLQFVQQQQLQHVQQLLQVVPAQLAQLQQLIQFVPQQIQQQQQVPQTPQQFGQTATGPWGVAPQIFGQSSLVM